MGLKKAATLQPGGFFVPKNHLTDRAILVEPKSVKKGVPNTYRGVTKHRDEVVADVSIFATDESVEKGEPSSVQTNVTFVHSMLTGTLEQIIGDASIFRVVKVQLKEGNEGFAFRPVEADTELAVERYYEQREAAVEALADTNPFA